MAEGARVGGRGRRTEARRSSRSGPGMGVDERGKGVETFLYKKQ